MLSKFAIAIGIEWVISLVLLSFAGANLSILPALTVLGVIVGANVVALKVANEPSA